MANDYNADRAVAEELIKEYGQPSTVIKKGVSGGKDAWGDPIADTPDTVINGIITPWLAAKDSEVNNTSVLMGDGFVFFHSDTAPGIGMQTTLNGQTYRIQDIKKLDSVDGINVYRKLQLRV